jgi:two-component system sensor histidine kinase DctS
VKPPARFPLRWADSRRLSRLSARLAAVWRRSSLWTLLVALVGALLVTLVWLAGRYEASQVQSKLERDTSDAIGDIRSGLTRNVQSLQALQVNDPTPNSWNIDAAAILREHR